MVESDALLNRYDAIATAINEQLEKRLVPQPNESALGIRNFHTIGNLPTQAHLA